MIYTDSNSKLNSYCVKVSNHARERAKQRNINLNRDLSIEEIKKMPIYTTDNGCTKYLDTENLVVYYVRQDKIVTMIQTNPIQMLKYYSISNNLNFNNLCRDHAFGNCNRGDQCKFIHVNYK